MSEVSSFGMAVPNLAFSPVRVLFIFAVRVEEYALSRTCLAVDLDQHVAARVKELALR